MRWIGAARIYAQESPRATLCLKVEKDETRLLEKLGERGSIAQSADIHPGMLDMLILKAVSLTPMHGYGVLVRISQISRDKIRKPQGSLYPALYRLEHQGLIESEWGESENKRKARFYRLTAAGKRRLREDSASWKELAMAVASVLSATPEEV